MKNAFNQFAARVAFTGVMARMLFAAATSEVGFTKTIKGYDMFSVRINNLANTLKREEAFHNTLFLTHGLMDEDGQCHPPKDINAMVACLDLALDKTKHLLENNDATGQSMGRLHYAAQLFTNWYRTQDRRIAEIINDQYGFLAKGYYGGLYTHQMSAQRHGLIPSV